MSERPQCTACDARDSLEFYAKGWWYCSCCGARVLVWSDGRIVRVIHAREHSSERLANG